MPFVPWIILLSIGLFFFMWEPPKKEAPKTPEQELGEALTKYLAKTKGSGS